MKYEDAADRGQPPEGWMCKTCRRWWGDDERMARWCCAHDLPCHGKACGGTGRTHKGSTACEACRKLSRDEAWAKIEKRPLPLDLRKEPLCLFDDDRYFFDAETLEDFAADAGVSMRDLRLMICVPVAPPTFEMSEWLADHTPEDGECSDEFDAQINAMIVSAAAETFCQGKYGVDPESIPVEAADAARGQS